MLAELKSLDRQKDEMIEKKGLESRGIRRTPAKKISEFENMLNQVENEWKTLYPME